jgi:hypothetical protein
VRRRIAESPARRFIAEPTAVAVLEEDEEPLVVKAPALDIHEGYITILDLHARQRIVTVIEVVSPANKYAGPGRKSYETKQREVIASDANLVEIDLLRAGKPLVRLPKDVLKKIQPGGYVINVLRVDSLDYEFYPRDLHLRLPRVGIPLRPGEPDVVLDIQGALARVYEAGAYQLRIDYNRAPISPLTAEDAVWANEWLISQGVRSASH